jgi:hypothetical protein
MLPTGYVYERIINFVEEMYCKDVNYFEQAQENVISQDYVETVL